MKSITITLIFALSLCGYCAKEPSFNKIEERGGWLFETASLKHSVRLMKKTWLKDNSKVTYSIYIDGKHLWEVDFNKERLYFTPVLTDAFEHVSSSLDLNQQDLVTLDFMTPDKTGYIASINFLKKHNKVTLASVEELNMRATTLELAHLKPFSGKDFTDPKSIFAPRLPTIKINKANKSQ